MFKCNKKVYIARYYKSKGRTDSRSEDEKPRYRDAMDRKFINNATFIVDSGCTLHITHDVRNLHKTYDIDPVSIHIAAERAVVVRQEGSVLFDMYPKYSVYIKHSSCRAVCCTSQNLV